VGLGPVLLLAQPGVATSQPAETLTVQRAIELTLERNLQLGILNVQKKGAEYDHLQSKLDYIPSANAGANMSFNYGALFIQGIELSNNNNNFNTSLSFSTPIIQGLAKYYTLKATKNTIDIRQKSIERVANELLTNLLTQYLNIAVLQSNRAIIDNRIALLTRQLARLEQLFAAGTVTRFQVLSVKSQLAAEEVNVVNNTNQIQNAELAILQFIQADARKSYVIQVPDSSVLQNETYPLPELRAVQEQALATLPQIKERALQVEQARWQTRLAKSNLYPSLSLSYAPSTNYSNATGFGNPAGPGPFFTQLDRNKAQSVNFRLNIPIFNGWRVQNQIRQARLGELVAGLNLKQTENQLLLEVQQAYQNVLQAEARKRSLREQLASSAEAFQMAEVQFAAGTIQFVGYLEALNNKTIAEQQLLQAKFDWFFRTKLLDVYQGKEVRF
jgi:outer membrane protein